MSYMDAVGFQMRGRGIEKLFETVRAANTLLVISVLKMTKPVS